MNHESSKRFHLEAELPHTTARPEESDEEMIDRVQGWEKDFKQSAQDALRKMHGFGESTVIDFRSLMGAPGHDEDDYELTVQCNPPDGKIGGEDVRIAKIVVRRAGNDSLQRG